MVDPVVINPLSGFGYDEIEPLRIPIVPDHLEDPEMQAMATEIIGWVRTGLLFGASWFFAIGMFNLFKVLT